jgi:hypothetical protein
LFAALIAAPALLLALATFGQPTPIARRSTDVPPQAATAGYKTLTFSTGPFTTANVDQNQTYGHGFQWYFWNLDDVSSSSSWGRINGDGSFTATNGNYNGTITSAAHAASSPNFVGTAFGGGAYFEAELAFDKDQVDVAHGWPAWWTLSLEHTLSTSAPFRDQWPGAPANYEHFGEWDLFEYVNGQNRPMTYNGTVHDWSGVFGKTCAPGECDFATNGNSCLVPWGTDFKQFHRYGGLWIPATDTTPGSLTYFFDDRKICSATTYAKYVSDGSIQPPAKRSSRWLYGILDVQHLVLAIGSGLDNGGQVAPLTVRSVKVWQANTSGNLSN